MIQEEFAGMEEVDNAVAVDFAATAEVVAVASAEMSETVVVAAAAAVVSASLLAAGSARNAVTAQASLGTEVNSCSREQR